MGSVLADYSINNDDFKSSLNMRKIVGFSMILLFVPACQDKLSTLAPASNAEFSVWQLMFNIIFVVLGAYWLFKEDL